MSTETTATATASLLETAYLTKGTIGNVGLPGAPIAHFSLVVSTVTQTVSGIVEITQALDRPSITVNVTGTIRATGYGKITQIVTLKGQYGVSLTPPAIGTYLQDFAAYMDLDQSWNGTGGFTYGGTEISDVPVVSAN
jgi:hypothetical protein